MVIGIIGSSLAGLVAGEKLAKAGHEVTVIEKNRELGGRLASLNAEGNILDYGISHFRSGHPDFKKFINQLKDKGQIKQWSSTLFEYFDGVQLHDINPNRTSDTYYIVPDGINAIAGKLSRWVDVKNEEKAGGLTHIGADRTKKRSWMVNLTDIAVFECDAVIIAAPAPEAYGVLQTTQDETPARRIIRHIDEIRYEPGISLMAIYSEQDAPSWETIECNDDRLSWIVNESSKRENPDASFVFHSSPEFAREHRESEPDQIVDQLINRVVEITGYNWLRRPKWRKVHFWKYRDCINPMDEQFLELEMEEAPLALVGDYLGGNTIESAYLSGLRLAEYWNYKYDLAEA